MTNRKIKKLIQGKPTQDGAGVKLVRVLSKPNIYDFDPFLMLDIFDSKNSEDYVKGFPWHPHRGIETITYLIRGKLEHGDSLGNKGLIEDGGCQWMTAGSGILHQEMPQPSRHVLGMQLWLNLAQTNKMAMPQYRDITSEMIPKIVEGKNHIHILSGYYQGVRGAILADYVPLTFLDVKMGSNSIWSLETEASDTAFIYVFQGQAIFDETNKTIPQTNAILYREGHFINVKTETEDVRFVVLVAPRLNETIAWGGPIVMNTEEELTEAFRQLRQGTFIQ